MFNPPAALIASRVLNGDATRAPDAQPQPRPRQQARVLDDPWREPFSQPPSRPARRQWTQWGMIALITPVRRFR